MAKKKPRRKITDTERLNWLLDTMAMTMNETSRKEIDQSIRANRAKRSRPA